MAYVDSSSTQTQVRNALADNASWAADQSLEKARNYHVAATVWLSVWAFDESLTGPSKMRFDELNKQIGANAAKALSFINSQAPAQSSSTFGNVVRVSVEDFRR
jgi:hypothetical protein